MANDPTTRRNFLQGGTAAAAGLLGASAASASQDPTPPRGAAPDQPEAGRPDISDGRLSDDQIRRDQEAGPDDPQRFPRFRFGRGGPVGSKSDRGKLTRGFREPGMPPVPVTMPDLGKLPWKWVNGAKEYHLVIEVVTRELLPGMTFYFWGFNGSMPGPLIEANQGDRVRFVVHNRLPEPTAVHVHGMELPNAMDGVEGLTQEPIPSGGTFVYEFDLHQDGTFFYHSHGAMQEVMGAVGMFVIHPEETHEPAVDHDFGLIFQQFSILPQADIPNSIGGQFNFFTINGRSGPYTTPMLLRLGSRARFRLLNFSPMNVHAIHLHGHTFWNTGTEGGRIPETAWIPRNTMSINIAQVNDIELVANNPGDWIFHCHVLMHMMNHMVSQTGPLGIRMASAVDEMSRGRGHVSGIHSMPTTGGLAGHHNLGSGGLSGSISGGEHTQMQTIPGVTGMAAGLDRGLPRVGGGLGVENALSEGIISGTPLGIEGMTPGIGRQMIAGGHALNDQWGPKLGHGLGSGTMPDQHRRTGPPIGGEALGGVNYHDPRWHVPGFPQDMMNMKEMMTSEEALKKINKPETNGMRHNWHIGVRAMMTVMRVLPDDLYEKVINGVPLPDGASVPLSGTDEGQRFDEERMEGPGGE